MKQIITESYLQAIANAIRSKNGLQRTYTPQQMAQAILDIPSGSGAVLVEKTVALKGTYNAEDDNADGYSKIVNNISWRMIPYSFDLHPNGYVMSKKWMINGSTVNYSDVYLVQASHRYFLTLGDTTGTRYRAIIVTTDPTGQDQSLDAVGGKMIVDIGGNGPSPRASAVFSSTVDGYFVVTKDNSGHSGIPTYLFDITKS